MIIEVKVQSDEGGGWIQHRLFQARRIIDWSDTAVLLEVRWVFPAAHYEMRA